MLDRTELSRLRERIKLLKVEKGQQRELYFQARQQHIRLIHERKDMDAKIQSKTCRGTRKALTYMNLKPLLI